MATQNYSLIPSEWTDLGPTPISVRAMSSPSAMICVSVEAPKTLNDPFTVVTPNDGNVPFRAPGYHVYARSASGVVRLAAGPEAGAGGDGSGSGGGGGPTTIQDGDDTAQGSRSDNPVTDETGPGTAIGLLKGLMTLIKGLTAEVATLNSLNAPFQSAESITLNVAFTPGRALKVDCDTAGKVSVQFVDGSTDLIPVVKGLNIIPGAFVKVITNGTTAVASYAVYR